MEYGLDSEREAECINRGLLSFETFFQTLTREGKGIGEDSRKAYRDLTDALISLERLRDRRIEIEKAEGSQETDLTADLESRLALTVYVILTRFNNTELKEEFLRMPWGKKLRNPDYMKGLLQYGGNSHIYKDLREILQLN